MWNFLISEVLIGAGGWDYFNVPGDRLRNYARAFKAVEVNSTYYVIPPLKEVESWRRRVPEGFEFTVRCNHSLIQLLQSEPMDQLLEIFEKMKRICSVLQASILHIQTPQTFPLSDEIIRKIDYFLSSMSQGSLRLAWEIRGGSDSEYQALLRVLEKHNVIHCVDLSKEAPAYWNSILYSRLFGKGFHNIYQFTNSELIEIDDRMQKSYPERAYLSFHGTRMYKDAARMSIYEAAGKFPKVTNSMGMNSVIEILKEDAQFPSTTSALINSQGWKVCEWHLDKQFHLSEILGMIEEKKFDKLSDLEAELNRLKI
ncbi:MAG: hypothetical protein QG670_44 [Thermoproteota archaeon]|nr:hypothetical protein [Thermoproteota archaeon]